MGIVIILLAILLIVMLLPSGKKKKPAGRVRDSGKGQKKKPAHKTQAVQSKGGKSSSKNKRQGIQKNQKIEKEQYPHFRRYKKSGHPALIVGERVDEENNEEYRYRKVMHSERDGRHLNEKVEPNPDPNDKKPMYIGKRVRHDKKTEFGNKLPWKYPNTGNNAKE